MELSSSIHDGGRYINRSTGRSKQEKGHPSQGGKPWISGPSSVLQDERQDVPHEPEQRTWTYDVATQMHNLFCQAPCFVNTSTSMDNGNPSDHRTDPPASPVKENSDDMALSGSSLHATPSPPIRFPSVHLDAEEWESGEEDNSAFFQTSNNGITIPSLFGTRVAGARSNKQSIFKKPANPATCKIPYFSSPSNCSASIATSATSKYGLYRSPAWSDEADDDDDESDVVSIAGDEDWQDFVPEYDSPASPNVYYNNHQQGAISTRRDSQSSNTVIDVTNVEDMFSDFTLTPEGAGYGSEKGTPR